jgi:hypothetical protein
MGSVKNHAASASTRTPVVDSPALNVCRDHLFDTPVTHQPPRHSTSSLSLGNRILLPRETIDKNFEDATRT